MMRYIIGGILLFLVGCSTQGYQFASIGFGKNTKLNSNDVWDDAGEVGCGFSLGHREPLNPERTHFLVGKWSHFSQCLAGPPFDDRYEDSSDHFYLSYEWQFNN